MLTSGGIPTYVVIPFKGKAALTLSLVWMLEHQGEYESVFLFDNGSPPDDWIDSGALPLDEMWVWGGRDASIYEMWNRGIRMALDAAGGRPCNIAILNNDLLIGPRFLSGLAEGLRVDDRLWAVCPNYDGRKFDAQVQQVSSTFKNQGLAGFAFMLRGEVIEEHDLFVDERLRWWFGDDDLVWKIEAAGGACGIVRDTWVIHIDGGSQTAGQQIPEDRKAIIRADADVYFAKWGHHYGLEPGQMPELAL